ncbi:expressed unknown protein [Seminavis robusta]|uniref:Transmembrane protein n=1 Tax=Seminavis robusta TaxID=568900 RepID=A0A9N8HVY6_9STRA|nr:expressed unknown protein [Seminavis robusta]|eukprot:Sro2031_g311840.1 n/a (185) ;mRNA; r:7360-7914
MSAKNHATGTDASIQLEPDTQSQPRTAEGQDAAIEQTALVDGLILPTVQHLPLGNPTHFLRPARQADLSTPGAYAVRAAGLRYDLESGTAPGCNADDHAPWGKSVAAAAAPKPDVLDVVHDVSKLPPKSGVSADVQARKFEGTKQFKNKVLLGILFVLTISMVVLVACISTYIITTMITWCEAV